MTANVAPAGRLSALRAVHARPELRRLQAAWAGSFAGEAIAAVAFGVFAYRSAGPTGVAFLVGIQMLPSAFLAPLVSAALQRMQRERLVLAVDLVRTLGAAGAVALSEAKAPREALFALAAALTVASAVGNPPRRGLLPLLVGAPAELTAAGVAASVVQAAAQTAGPLVAALLFGVTSVSVVLGAAALCFAAAALAEAALPSTADLAVRPHAVEQALRFARTTSCCSSRGSSARRTSAAAR
jgi:hypothetical protein